MSTSPSGRKLTLPSTVTDAELEAAVAEHVAGFKRVQHWPHHDFVPLTHMVGDIAHSVPRYATDTNAALALFPRYEHDHSLRIERWLVNPRVDDTLEWAIGFIPHTWVHSNEYDGPDGDGYLRFMSRAPTFARAAALALLRVAGVEVAPA